MLKNKRLTRVHNLPSLCSLGALLRGQGHEHTDFSRNVASFDQVLILLTERGEDICVCGSDISYALSWFSLCWKEESLVLAYVTVPLFCSHT